MKNIITRLQTLKYLEPRADTISALKDRILSSVEENDASFAEAPTEARSVRSFIPLRYAYAAALLVFVLLIAVQWSSLIYGAHTLYYQARITMASNGYEQALVSLELAKTELAGLENGNVTPAQIAYVSDAAAETNKYMAALNLTGIPGEYSTEQCLHAYQAYEEYLEELQTTVRQATATADPGAQASLRMLQEQASGSEQEANARLKLY